MPSSFSEAKYRYCHSSVVFMRLVQHQTQELRAELQAAETKDKKFTKRKTVLKKIVANITMGNDSLYCPSSVSYPSSPLSSKCLLCSRMSSSVWEPHYWRSKKVRLF